MRQLILMLLNLADNNLKAAMVVMFIVGYSVCFLLIARLSDAPYVVNTMVSMTGGVISSLLTLTALALCYGNPDEDGGSW